MEKLSSLWFRFMPTFVSPATSIFKPTVPKWSQQTGRCVNAALRPRVRIVDTRQGPLADTRNPQPTARLREASGRCAKGDRRLVKLVAAQDEELHGFPGRVLREEIGQFFRGVDGVAIDGGGEVRVRL